MEAFVYCWTDHKYKKLYIGWHKGNAFDGYVCSSKVMLEEYSIRKSDFTRQIIASGSISDMVAFEAALLLAVNAKNDYFFYNMHNGDGKFYHTQKHTKSARLKMSKAHAQRSEYAKGWKYNDKQKNTHKKGLNGFWQNLTQEQKNRQAEIRESDKKKRALKKRNTEIRVCPHCAKTGSGFGMDRWHMNNCRHKNEY